MGDGQLVETSGIKRTRIQIRNEAKILQCAEKVFAAHGFKGSTVEKIANLADMSQPNLHHYFATKADLYLAVLQQILKNWLEPLAGLDPDGDPADELRHYIDRKLEMSRKSPEASRVFAHEMLEGAPMLRAHLRGYLKDTADDFAKTINGWVKAGVIRDVDPHHLLFMIWATTQHYADFAPQVKALLGVTQLTRREYSHAAKTISGVILNGLIVSEAGS